MIMRDINENEMRAVTGGMSECEAGIRQTVSDYLGPGYGGMIEDLVRWFC